MEIKSKKSRSLLYSKPLICFGCHEPFAHERFYSGGYTFCDLLCKKQFEAKSKIRKQEDFGN